MKEVFGINIQLDEQIPIDNATTRLGLLRDGESVAYVCKLRVKCLVGLLSVRSDFFFFSFSQQRHYCEARAGNVPHLVSLRFPSSYFHSMHALIEVAVSLLFPITPTLSPTLVLWDVCKITTVD